MRLRLRRASTLRVVLRLELGGTLSGILGRKVASTLNVEVLVTPGRTPSVYHSSKLGLVPTIVGRCFRLRCRLRRGNRPTSTWAPTVTGHGRECSVRVVLSRMLGRTRGADRVWRLLYEQKGIQGLKVAWTLREEHRGDQRTRLR